MNLVQRLAAEFAVEEKMALVRLHQASDTALISGTEEARRDVRLAADALLEVVEEWGQLGQGMPWHTSHYTGPLGQLRYCALAFARLWRAHHQGTGPLPEGQIEELLILGGAIGAMPPFLLPSEMRRPPDAGLPPDNGGVVN